WWPGACNPLQTMRQTRTESSWQQSSLGQSRKVVGVELVQPLDGQLDAFGRDDRRRRRRRRDDGDGGLGLGSDRDVDRRERRALLQERHAALEAIDLDGDALELALDGERLGDVVRLREKILEALARRLEV